MPGSTTLQIRVSGRPHSPRRMRADPGEGAVKARFTRQGNEFLTQYCIAKRLPLRRCGKLVVARVRAQRNGCWRAQHSALAAASRRQSYVILLNCSGVVCAMAWMCRHERSAREHSMQFAHSRRRS